MAQQKELRQMRRAELIEIIYALKQREKTLTAENAELQEALNERTLHISQAGTIAEAALGLNQVFDAAQAAADQYLHSIQAMQADTKRACADAIAQADRVRDAAQAEADECLAAAHREAQAVLDAAERRSAQLNAEAEAALTRARRQSEAILAEAKRRRAETAAHTAPHQNTPYQQKYNERPRESSRGFHPLEDFLAQEGIG